MATNRLYLTCKVCDERNDKYVAQGSEKRVPANVVLARLSAGEGDWSESRVVSLVESIPMFINFHRWHHPSGGGLDHIVIEWENDVCVTRDATVLPDYSDED